MDKNYEYIRNRIKKLRDERGWSNARLAREADIGISTLSYWFRAKAKPEIAALIRVCKAFGITIGQFFNDDLNSITLTDDQKEYLSGFNQINQAEKAMVLNMIKTLIENRQNSN